MRLDEDFLFLFSFAKKYMKSIQEQPLTQKWMDRLLLGPEEGIFAKNNRNTYLNKLIACLQTGHLHEPFLSPPPNYDLPPWESDDYFYAYEEPEKWIEDLIRRENDEVHVGGKDFETYLSTKILDENRGACAYLAVSVANEGDQHSWHRLINSNMQNRVNKLFKKFQNPNIIPLD